MAQFDCELDTMGGEDACAKGKGVRRIYAANNDLIDWDAMFADPTKWDPVNEIVLGYIYKTGGEHFEIKFDRTNSTFNAERTRDNGYYEVLAAIQMEGNSPARSKKIKRYVECCNLQLHLYMANGTQRSLGMDYDGDGFLDPVLKFEIERHRSDAGAFGGDESRDELDFSGQNEFDPLFANVPVADLIASGGGAVMEAYGPDANDQETVFGTEADGATAYGANAGPVTPASSNKEEGPTSKVKTTKTKK